MNNIVNPSIKDEYCLAEGSLAPELSVAIGDYKFDDSQPQARSAIRQHAHILRQESEIREECLIIDEKQLTGIDANRYKNFKEKTIEILSSLIPDYDFTGEPPEILVADSEQVQLSVFTDHSPPTIIVSKGLLNAKNPRAPQNDSEFAGFLAHEIGHAFLAEKYPMPDKSSKPEEATCDKIACKLLLSAKDKDGKLLYDPMALISYFRRQIPTDDKIAITATGRYALAKDEHPVSATRVTLMEQYVAQHVQANGNYDCKAESDKNLSYLKENLPQAKHLPFIDLQLNKLGFHEEKSSNKQIDILHKLIDHTGIITEKRSLSLINAISSLQITPENKDEMQALHKLANLVLNKFFNETNKSVDFSIGINIYKQLVSLLPSEKQKNELGIFSEIIKASDEFKKSWLAADVQASANRLIELYHKLPWAFLNNTISFSLQDCSFDCALQIGYPPPWQPHILAAKNSPKPNNISHALGLLGIFVPQVVTDLPLNMARRIVENYDHSQRLYTSKEPPQISAKIGFARPKITWGESAIEVKIEHIKFDAEDNVSKLLIDPNEQRKNIELLCEQIKTSLLPKPTTQDLETDNAEKYLENLTTDPSATRFLKHYLSSLETQQKLIDKITQIAQTDNALAKKIYLDFVKVLDPTIIDFGSQSPIFNYLRNDPDHLFTAEEKISALLKFDASKIKPLYLDLTCELVIKNCPTLSGQRPQNLGQLCDFVEYIHNIVPDYTALDSIVLSYFPELIISGSPKNVSEITRYLNLLPLNYPFLSARISFKSVLKDPQAWSKQPSTALDQWLETEFLLDNSFIKLEELVENWPEQSAQERIQLCEKLLESGKNIPISHLRNKVLKIWAEAVTEHCGSNYNNVNPSENLAKYKIIVDNFCSKKNISVFLRHQALNSLADCSVAQKELSDYLDQKIEHFTQKDIQKLNFGILLTDQILLEASKSREKRLLVSNFLRNEFSYDSARKLIQDLFGNRYDGLRSFKNSLAYLRAFHALDQEQAMYDSFAVLHKEFASAPIAIKATVMRNLHLPPGDDASEQRNLEFEKALSQIPADNSALSAGLKAFLPYHYATMPAHEQSIFVGLLFGLKNPYDKLAENNISESIAKYCEAEGPGFVRAFQRAHSLPDAPREIAESGRRMKSNAAELSRSDIIKLIYDTNVVPPELFKEIKSIGPKKGGGAFRVAIEVTLQNNQKAILVILRPNALKRAERNYQRLEHACSLAGEKFNLIKDLCRLSYQSALVSTNVATNIQQIKRAQELYNGVSVDFKTGYKVKFRAPSLVLPGNLSEADLTKGRAILIETAQGKQITSAKPEEIPTQIPQAIEIIENYFLLGNKGFDEDPNSGNTFFDLESDTCALVTRIDPEGIPLAEDPENEYEIRLGAIIKAAENSPTQEIFATKLIEELKKVAGQFSQEFRAYSSVLALNTRSDYRKLLKEGDLNNNYFASCVLPALIHLDHKSKEKILRILGLGNANAKIISRLSDFEFLTPVMIIFLKINHNQMLSVVQESLTKPKVKISQKKS